MSAVSGNEMVRLGKILQQRIFQLVNKSISAIHVVQENPVRQIYVETLNVKCYVVMYLSFERTILIKD